MQQKVLKNEVSRHWACMLTIPLKPKRKKYQLSFKDECQYLEIFSKDPKGEGKIFKKILVVFPIFRNRKTLLNIR